MRTHRKPSGIRSSPRPHSQRLLAPALLARDAKQEREQSDAEANPDCRLGVMLAAATNRNAAKEMGAAESGRAVVLSRTSRRAPKCAGAAHLTI